MKYLTGLEISKKYAGDIPKWQHKKNEQFFNETWRMLNDDGIYAYPAAGKMFMKNNDVPGTWFEVN